MKTAIYLGFSSMKNFGDWWLFEIIKNDLSALNVVPLPRLLPKYRMRRMMYAGWESRLVPSPSITLLGGGTILLPLSDDFLRPLNATRGKKYSVGSGAKSVEECHQWKLISAARHEELRRVYEEMDELTVRGPISRAAMLDLGLKRDVEIVGDGMLSIFNSQTQPHSWDGKTVWLNTSNLRDNQGHYWMQAGEDEVSLYGRLIESSRKRGLDVRIFYCAPEDQAISETIARQHNISDVRSVLTPDEMDAVLTPGVALIATRLHAMIYAILRGIPTSALLYQDKHLDFLYSIQWPNKLPRLSEIPIGKEFDHIEAMWNDNVQQWSTLSAAIQSLNATRRAFYDRVQSKAKK